MVHTQNSHTVEITLKLKKQNSLEKSEYLNLPDLQFFQWCHSQYGLNKGVYNTIDQWFYGIGIERIQYRRIFILKFLDFSKDCGAVKEHQKFIRFGNGGLIRRLQGFMWDINLR
ncbi:hypothetical protein [Neobacillus sp. SuZ13]|uniref:hypothetical protein n=1 Tax=Neobacillus sp. SuZ13 TaxID=3047875 RepID=UPI0024C04E81|nr:hypothetical protein [Neobacillus sp. SuZ13]WHY69389.1 hypothetical protein QNH17_12405 [Neobacillus sp. SuZ13]